MTSTEKDETDARASPDQRRHASRNAPHHLLTAGAERHADADLARSSGDRKRDDGIETDARQHQAEAAEARRGTWRRPSAPLASVPDPAPSSVR
jgi:hypothetical protein